uniref:Protein TIC 214 n=1 Tax=Juniperus cedrus TaxID=746016 RepID=A0A0N9XQP3_9CONI|nr:hypothetical chloroplast RF1 [Juniperus cedrus]ALI30936.1 hypothetical chloroplast RF1 [Juniperus cedrus]
MITSYHHYIIPWVQGSTPILLFGVYYGFLATLPIGPAQMYFIRSMLIQNKVIDNRKIVPAGNFVLSGSFVAQLVVFSSIYVAPIYASIWKPHLMTIMLVPVLFFLIFQRSLIRRYPWLQNPAVEFFIGVALQLLNPALFGKSIYTRLINLMLFRYSGNFLFLLSTAAGWLSGQILFVKMTKIFCSRVENDVPLQRDRRGEFFLFSFQILFFGYAMLACYGRNPSLIATKWNDSRTFIQGPREELEELSLELSDKKKSFRSELKSPNKKKKHKKHKPETPTNTEKNEENVNKPSITLPSSFKTLVKILSDQVIVEADKEKISPFLIKRWPLILFDSNRFNDPLRYVSIGDYILRGPVRSQVAEYFFDVCLSDGHQKISFTAPPSISFFAKMASLGDQSLDSNQDHLDEWIEKKWERKTSLGEELENRVRALSNGSPVVKILEKKMRFSRTKDKKRLSEVDDPLLSGPFRGSMNQYQFKSPWMLYSEEYLKEQKKKLAESKNQDSTNKNHDYTNKNRDSTNRLCRFSLIRPENKERIVQPRIKLISKWWIEKIRMVLLEEQNRRKWLDESTLEDLKNKYEKIYPKNLSSLEYVFNTLVPAPLKERIEKDIASCEKKLLTNYLLHIFLETTGTKWELLLSALPTEQALLYERLFNSDEFSDSRVSMDIEIEISEKDILKDFAADILEEDPPSSNKEHTKDKKHKSDKSNIHLDEYFFEKERSEQDMRDFADFHELYVLYSKLIEKDKTRLDDYEPRIRDFNRFVVPKLPSTLLSGVHDPIAVKDCLETRPKKARQLIIIRPFDKLAELEKKKKEAEEKEKNEVLEAAKKRLFKPLKEKALEEETLEQEEADKGGDEEEEDLQSKDIYVFSYPYEGDFRRDLVKGAVRFQRRKVSAINHWIPRPESILFGRLKSMTQKSHNKPVPKKDEKKRLTARSQRIYDKFLERRERRKEDRRRRTQQTFDGEVIHYVRASLLFTHTYLRKRLYFPILIAAKNIGRTLLFQVPEWEQDWFNLEKESYLKCNYDGYELTDPDVPKKFLKDYIKEGIQIKIVYPFRLKPWYEPNEIEKKTTGYLTIYGTEIESPFGNPPDVPSFWEPIGEWIWNYTSDRAKPIIEPTRELIELIQKKSEAIKEKAEMIKEKVQTIKETVKKKINLDNRKEINLDTRKEKIIRTKPTSNIQFSLEIVEDEPFSIQMKQNLDIPDPDDWTITMNDRINQMNEEYRFNLDIYNKLKADFKQRMDQPSPNIKSKLKKEWIRIKIWRSSLQKKTIRFIRKKLPFFMKVIHFRVKLLFIDLKISMFNMIESNLEFCMQLSRSFETIQKIFNSNHPISKNVESKCQGKVESKCQGKEISQAYVFHQIWKEIRNMKGLCVKDLIESRASSPFIKKNVKEFLDSQGILDCKHPGELTINHWKQWLKWCAGYRIDPHRNKKRKHVIGNRLGWTEFASFLGEKRFATFMARLKNRIKRHRYDLLAYSYLDHMKENNHGPAIQYIPEPDYQAITNFQNPGFSKKKKKKKKNDSSWKKFFSSKKKKKNCDSSKSKKRNVDFCAATKKNYYKKSRYYKFQFWLFPDLRKKIKNANKLGDVFPPNIIRRQIEEMWKFREIQVPKDFDVDAFVIESLRKQEEEKRRKAAAAQELKEARRKRKEERIQTREARRKKLESATSPEEVERLTRTFKLEDDLNKKERRRQAKKRLLKEQRVRQLAKIAAQKAKEQKREERKRKLAELNRKRKSSKRQKKNFRDFLVRDFCNIYYPKLNIDKINMEKEEVRLAIKEIILRQDAKKASQGDKKAWDRVKSKLDEKYQRGDDEKYKKGDERSETKTKPKKADEQEIDFRTAKTEYLKQQKRLQREAKRLAREEQLKEEMKLEGKEGVELEKDRLAYREMATNIYTWRMKYELEKLPLTPWVTKFRNAARFFDRKKLGGETEVANLLFPYAENGDLDFELLDTVLYLKSVFPKHNDIRRVFCEAARRSMPLVPGYFNDRFFVYKIASLLFKLKKKKRNVNLFDRSRRRINEKISSSFIFEDLFLPRRRREFRILNLLNLENNLDESVRSSSQEIPNDQGLMKKNEHLIVDTRQKIRRFLWPRYRLEDLICMNRFWWNTNNGSRSAMLRVRMYPKIDHWEHITNNLYFLKLKHSFISIREAVQKFGNHAKSLLGTKQSPVAGHNEALNEVKHKKEDSFCSISSSLPSDPSPYNKLLTILRKIISELIDSIREWIGSLLSKLRDSIMEWISSLLSQLRAFLIKRISSLKDFIIKSMRELFSKLKLQLKRFLNPLKKKLRKWIDQKRRKWIDPLINKLKTQLINFRRFLRNLLNEIRNLLNEIRNLLNEIRVKLVNFLCFLRDIIDGLLVKLEKPRRFSRWNKIQNCWNKIQNSRLISFIRKCYKAYQCYNTCCCLVDFWRSSRR